MIVMVITTLINDTDNNAANNINNTNRNIIDNASCWGHGERQLQTLITGERVRERERYLH